jgi:hypothetical protein
MSVFLCPLQECGRRFKEEARLIEHIERRHGDQENLKDISNLPKQSAKEGKDEFKETILLKKEDIMAQEKHLQEELEKLDEKEEEIKISQKDIGDTKKKLTNQFILEKSGCDHLEEITQVIIIILN